MHKVREVVLFNEFLFDLTAIVNSTITRNDGNIVCALRAPHSGRVW